MTDDNKKRGPGRPTEKRKDTILRLRIDTDTHRKLSECAAVRQVSMSELVREAIDEIFRREKEKQQNMTVLPSTGGLSFVDVVEIG